MTEHRGPSDARSGVFRRLLVGFDGSSEARYALRIARSLASDLGGEVHVLTVVTPRAHAETDEERLAMFEEERIRLTETLSTVQPVNGRDGPPISHVIYHDDPAEALAAFALEHGFDLVVVGTHGRDQIMHRGVGRSLEALIRSHNCPVLVV
ncbi:MAG TPA: universal stress protein [Acidimicrobiales bacterium]|jgi:nucleotide-binding universal stress UspA family protein